MKQISSFTGWIALIAVVVLYVLFFTQSSPAGGANKGKSSDAAPFQIAYFNSDTLQKYYKAFLEAEEKMKEKETSSRNLLSGMSARYQKRLGELQAKARSNAMTEAEGQAAQQELGRLENEYRQKDDELNKELKDMQTNLMIDLNKKVETYLQEYNKGKKYAYIFSYQPGMFIYYKDSLYDITQDMISTLNKQYSK